MLAAAQEISNFEYLHDVTTTIVIYERCPLVVVDRVQRSELLLLLLL